MKITINNESYGSYFNVTIDEILEPTGTVYNLIVEDLESKQQVVITMSEYDLKDLQKAIKFITSK